MGENCFGRYKIPTSDLTCAARGFGAIFFRKFHTSAAERFIEHEGEPARNSIAPQGAQLWRRWAVSAAVATTAERLVASGRFVSEPTSTGESASSIRVSGAVPEWCGPPSAARDAEPSTVKKATAQYGRVRCSSFAPAAAAASVETDVACPHGRTWW